jgi:hypothetical protein
MSSKNNAIEAALIEAASIRNRVYVFADDLGEDGYCAVNEEECFSSDLEAAIGFAEFDSKQKQSKWITL